MLADKATLKATIVIFWELPPKPIDVGSDSLNASVVWVSPQLRFAKSRLGTGSKPELRTGQSEVTTDRVAGGTIAASGSVHDTTARKVRSGYCVNVLRLNSSAKEVSSCVIESILAIDAGLAVRYRHNT